MPRLSPAPSAQPQLRPYQEAGVAWLRDRPRAFLADEAGLGKSRQFVEAARGRTLVVAPGMVLDGGTWDEETERWARDPGAFTQVAYSSLNTRVKTGANASATRPTDELKPEYREPWDSVILDEAHYIKGRKSHWTKAVLNLKAEQVHLGTGTPIPNWADELFIPLQVLHPEKAHPGGELGSYWRWAREWFDCSPTRWSQGMPSVGELLACSPACLDRPPTDPCGHYLEFAEANLGDLFLQRLRDDVLTDLPPLTKVIVETPMTKAQAAAYNALKKDFVAWAGEHGEEIVAWNEAALNEQLIKLSVGLDVIRPELRGSGKLDRLRWDLSSRSRPTFVVAHHKEVLRAAKRVVCDPMGLRVAIVDGDTSKAQRRSKIAAFKAGELDVLLGSLETVSEGLTLVQADMCIMLEESYKPSRNEQAIRRIHRLGQERPVEVLIYRTPRSVDGNKAKLLELKNDRQMRHLTAAQFASIV